MSHEKKPELIAALGECAMECSHCVAACLKEEDVKMMERCIRLDLDCAEICQLAARWIARGSEHANHLLKECMEICDACADECEKHSDMEHCRECAEACRNCAEECKKAMGEPEAA